MRSGTLHIVGLGPGGAEHRPPAAVRAVAEAEAVVGYTAYVDAVADLLHDGQLVVRGVMGEEERRADEALVLAAEGARVALVSSGDAGVHGMAARTLARAALDKPVRDLATTPRGTVQYTLARFSSRRVLDRLTQTTMRRLARRGKFAGAQGPAGELVERLRG